jgi:CheY-specific phosphatase CheX
MENTKKIQEVMMNSIFDVFEKMFFVFLERLDEDVKYDMVTSINFFGPLKGDIKIYFSKAIVRTMVQNMLGLEEKDVTDKEIEDCAKEAVNMISGNFLQKLDSSKVFDLSIPEFEKKSGTFTLTADQTKGLMLKFAFDSDEQLLGISMNIA